MNIGSKIILTALKSALLATLLLGLVLIGQDEGKISKVLPFVSFVVLIIFIISIFGIVITILPFYYHCKSDLSMVIFKKYFPIYALLIFMCCLTFTIMAEHVSATILFGISYVTSMFAWVWFFRPTKKQ